MGTKKFSVTLIFVEGVQKPFTRLCWGTKIFCQILPGLKNFFKSSKIPSASVPVIKNDYSLRMLKKQLKNIKGVTEEVYKTLYRLLGQFGKTKFAQVKQKIKNIFKNGRR